MKRELHITGFTGKFCLSVILLFFSISFSAILAQDVNQHRATKAKIEKEIEYIDKQILSTQSQQRTNSEQLNLTKAKIDARKKLLKEMDSEIAGYDRSINTTNREIHELGVKLDTLKSYYQRLILNTYKNRDSRSWFMHILASENLGQGYRRYIYLKSISGRISDQADQIRTTEDKLMRERSKLNQLKSELVISRKTREKEFEQLAVEEKKLQTTISQLKRKESDFRKELNAKKSEVERLNKEIERLLTEAVKQQQTDQKKGVEVDSKLSEKFDNNKGKLPWPVKQGVVIEKYGQHNHPVFPNIKLPFNNGINISTDKNADVLSVFDGVIVKILVIPGYNQCVMIQHGAYFTFYCKLGKVNVKLGDTVKTGEKLGSLEEAEGNSTLHFEVWNQTTKQDPEQWLRK